MPTFSGMRLRRKTRAGCNGFNNLNSGGLGSRGVSLCGHHFMPYWWLDGLLCLSFGWETVQEMVATAFTNISKCTLYVSSHTLCHTSTFKRGLE
jgi:hypothetical protein